MIQDSSPLIVESTRAGVVEKEYLVDVFACDTRGNTLISLGKPDRLVYPRSAIKILQALDTVESGAADHFGLSGGELAVSCSSHIGEITHVAAAQSMLAKAGIKSKLLLCGSEWPRHIPTRRSMFKTQRTPTALHHNCSGKHSCGLCWLVYHGKPLQDYIHPDHPLQISNRHNIERFTGEDLHQSSPGVDECSYPTYPLPLNSWANAMARVADPSGFPQSTQHALGSLLKAVAQNPFMVAGEDTFVSTFLRQNADQIYIKNGADGVMMAATSSIPHHEGVGLALKVRSGQGDIASIALSALLGELGVLSRDKVSEWGVKKRLNANGIVVGEVRAVMP